MKKIKLAWPELNYSTAPGVLILLPSVPTIAPLNQGQLTSWGLSRNGVKNYSKGPCVTILE